MADKELLAFPDKDVKPTDESIFSIIGSNKDYWQRILKSIPEKHKDISWSWNYYNDGKRWLFKLIQKKKTLFWGAVLTTGDFRTTFYFGNKAEPLVVSSDIPEKHKEEFLNAKRFGSLRAISILVRSDEDVDTVLKLADLKSKIK